MAKEEEKCIEIVIKNDDPGRKSLGFEFENIGFLKKEATFVDCPACEVFALSTVHLEAVTCFQRFLKSTKICKNFESRMDINHYCSNCGCFIGRYIPIGIIERCISRSARKQAAMDTMSLKTKPKDCPSHMQKMREHVKNERANEKVKKDARKMEEKSRIDNVNGH